MGRIKELREKLARDGLSEAEQKELDTLLAEAKAEEGDEEKAIDDAAEKLASVVNEQSTARLKSLEEKLDEILSEKKTVEVRTPSYIVDKKLGGRKSVEELNKIKVELPNRDDKKHKEVSQGTMHFIQAMITGDVQKLQVLVEGTNARGGFLVPDDYANVLVEDIRDLTVMRQLADVMTTTSDTLHVPILGSRPKASWRSEAAVKSTTTVDFTEIQLTPYSLASIVGLSNELVADATLGVSPSIVSKVAQLQGRSLAETEDRAFWVGSGTGQPTGVDNYTFTTITAGLSDASRADALIQAYHRLSQGYRNRGVFVANSRTLERIHTLKDGNNNYLVSDLAGGPTPTLRGRPIYEQNDIGDGKVFFGDFSHYIIADREGIDIRVSDEATVASQSAFERNLTYVRVEKRVDGELTRTEPVIEITGVGAP